MRLRFQGNLDDQLAAIESVCNRFRDKRTVTERVQANVRPPLFLPTAIRPDHRRLARRSARVGRPVTGPDPIGPDGGSSGPRMGGPRFERADATTTGDTRSIRAAPLGSPLRRPFRKEPAPRLSEIGLPIPDDALRKRPSFRPVMLSEYDGLGRFLGAFDWILSEIKKVESSGSSDDHCGLVEPAGSGAVAVG